MKIFDILIFFQEHQICIWFNRDIPHFNIDGIIYVKGMVNMNKKIQYTENEKEIIHYLLSKYKMYRSVFQYPFLKYPEFILKEGILYSKDISLQYIVYDETVYGPIYCDICKDYYLNPYYSFMHDFCKRCKESIDKIYIPK
jgi:hypothetical protein